MGTHTGPMPRQLTRESSFGLGIIVRSWRFDDLCAPWPERPLGGDSGRPFDSLRSSGLELLICNRPRGATPRKKIGSGREGPWIARMSSSSVGFETCTAVGLGFEVR